MTGKLSQSQQLVTASGLTAPETEEAVGQAFSWLVFYMLIALGNLKGLLLGVTCRSPGAANVCYLDTVLSRRPLCYGHSLDSYDLGHMLRRRTFSVPVLVVFQATSSKTAQRQSSSVLSFAVNSETPVVPSLLSSGPVLPGLGAPTTTG